MPFEKHKNTSESIVDSKLNNKTSSNIKNVKLPNGTEVYDLVPQNIKDVKLNYSQIKTGFLGKDQTANSRFELNELSRKVMSVEEEDEIRIDTEVRRRVKVLLESLHDKVKKAAHAEGFEQGRNDGRANVIEELAPVTERITSLLKSFDTASMDIVLANEHIISRIVYLISKKVLLKEVAQDTDFIKRSAVSIIEKLGTRENIRIFLSPESFKDADSIKSDILTSVNGLKNISIEACEDIVGAGCRVETDFGNIDATLEKQLEQLSANLSPTETN